MPVERFPSAVTQVAPPPRAFRLVLFHRKWSPGFYSMERVTSAIRAHLPPEIDCQPVSCKRASKGLTNRILDCLHAFRCRGDVNHVIGDVHYMTFLLPRSRTILTIHDCRGMSDLHGWKRSAFLWLWLKIPVWRASLVTVISEQTREDVLRYTGCSVEKIKVIPDPVPEGLRPSPKPFNADCPRILQVGTSVHKNLEGVVSAIRGLRCFLDVIGTLSPAQRRMLDQSGVPYTAAHDLTDDEVAAKYRNCDLVTFVSRFEGFGLPILEANAVGRPIVTSNRRPTCDVANGAACLVDPDDAASIRDGIDRVINDAAFRERIVAAGYENASRHTAKTIADMYLRAYWEALESASAKKSRWSPVRARSPYEGREP